MSRADHPGGRRRIRRPAHNRRTSIIGLAVALVAPLAVGLVATSGLVASADPGSSAAPVRAEDIPNLGVVKNQIKAYYGDYVDANGEHQASATSNYASEVMSIEHRAKAKLNKVRRVAGRRALVFDVDDTTLLTYNYEAANDFAYIPAVNAQYVLGQRFPQVFGMARCVTQEKRRGYAIFFVTGRPDAQHAATLGNLAKDGYPRPTAPTTGEDGLNTKPNSGQAFPSYVDGTLDGNPACSTIEYKSGTRKHIESLGYKIIGNFGDQYSDLVGGYSRYTFKLPNPMYYLP